MYIIISNLIQNISKTVSEIKTSVALIHNESITYIGIYNCLKEKYHLNIIRTDMIQPEDINTINKSNIVLLFNWTNNALFDKITIPKLIISDAVYDLALSKLNKRKFKGIFHPEDEIQNLYKAINTIVKGGEYFSKKIIINMMLLQSKSEEKKPTNSIENKLTKKEMMVVNLYKMGKSSKEIAELLNVSIRTVGSHKNHIFAKLGIHTVHELLSKFF